MKTTIHRYPRMSKQTNQIYEFGEFRLETSERLLIRDGKAIPLTPKAFETLLVLVRSGGHLLEKEVLLKEVWPDAFVEEANLARNIWALRKALGDDNGEHRYVETVPKLGYRFVAPVTELPDGANSVVIQRRLRARIVTTEESLTNVEQTPLVPERPTLSLADPRKRRIARVSALLIAGLVVSTIIILLLVYNSRSRLSTKAIDSIAVLPFANQTNDPELDYLSDGITENLIDRLSQASHVKIIAHNSVAGYKGKEIDAREVGRVLGVQALLVGRVAQRGEQLSVSSELIDVRDGSHLWGDHREGKVANLRLLQEELVKHVTDSLRLQFRSVEQETASKGSRENPEAYQNYLKGRYFWNKRTEAGLQKGIEYFNKSIDGDPTYAPAYAGLADSYIMLANWRFAPSADAYQKARAAALRALEIDSQLAEAKTSLAYTTLLYQWDWNGAEKLFREAIALNPNYASAHHFYSICLLTAGRQEEALAEIQRAQELDPLSLIITSVHGWIHYEDRQFDQATNYFIKALEMDPRYVPALLDLGACYLRRGETQKAMDQFEKARAADGDTGRILADLAQGYAISGQKESALKILDQIEHSANSRFISPWDLSFVYAALGDKTRAIELLEKATDEKVGWVVSLGVEPGFDSLRSDARFQKLADRVGIPAGKH
ncbi:MAG TPA: tetratricopeptide repeat protein [Pyrinomonadaceae bacterium]|jgi:TolB-like protein/DNA-binding winged helix-turn-helix (wHTH) protein/Tfp pilus assembly protein PilF